MNRHPCRHCAGTGYQLHDDDQAERVERIRQQLADAGFVLRSGGIMTAPMVAYVAGIVPAYLKQIPQPRSFAINGRQRGYKIEDVAVWLIDRESEFRDL